MPNDRSDPAARFDAGLQVRRDVLGADYVDRVMAAQTAFDAPFQRFVTEVAWGSVWAREELDRRTRSLITIALLAALGRWEQLEGHLRATRNTGATPEEIREALLHVAVYAGIPAANTAFALARKVLAEGEAPTNAAGDSR
jgi:4-carboxymuconolactone decarboxylase